MARPAPAITLFDELTDLSEAAPANARTLLAAAKLLAEAGIVAVAHTPAKLSLEENSKSRVCAMVALLPAESVDPAEFWDGVPRHRRPTV